MWKTATLRMLTRPRNPVLFRLAHQAQLAWQTKENRITQRSDIRSLDWKEHIRLRPGSVHRQVGRWCQCRRWHLCVAQRGDRQQHRRRHLMGHGQHHRGRSSKTTSRACPRLRPRHPARGRVVDCVSKINTGAQVQRQPRLLASRWASTAWAPRPSTHLSHRVCRMESVREGQRSTRRASSSACSTDDAKVQSTTSLSATEPASRFQSRP